MTSAPRNPDIIMVWPSGRDPVVPAGVPGYTVQSLPPLQDPQWIDIHRRAVPHFSATDLASWLVRYRELALPDGILVAIDEASGAAVATAGSLAHDKNGMFPGGGQLGWVATDPAHRRRGLARWLSALATERLVREGYSRIFLCTGDDMPDAIKVYRRIGYTPCLYASDQVERWTRICAVTGLDHEPDRWPTLAQFLDES